MWQKIRSGFMFGVACIASPCCTPLIVPLGLALLAGTPVAVWASAHLGWVYGGLTLLSIVSLVLGLRWLGQKPNYKSSKIKTTAHLFKKLHVYRRNNMNTNLTENQPLACDPNALTHEQQEHWVKEIAPKLYKAVQEIQELPNGWAWRLPITSEMLLLVAEDLNMERLCCPFVNYTLVLEPNHGPFWLHMTGSEGVKEFLRIAHEGANLFDAQVAKAAGFDNSASPEIDSVETALKTAGQLNAQYAKVGVTN